MSVKTMLHDWLAREYVPESGDTWLVSYPRSGNTWVRYVLATYFEGASGLLAHDDLNRHVPDVYEVKPAEIRAIGPRRVLKSHAAFRPEYGTVIYLVRDPRDVFLSYLHQRAKRSLDASPGAYAEGFLAGGLDPYGTWGEHVGGWLGARAGRPDFHVFRYEDLVAAPEGQFTSMLRAADIDVDPILLGRALELCSPDQLRRSGQEKRGVKMEVRRATAGYWVDELAPDIRQQLEARWHDQMRLAGYEALSGRS